MLLRLQKYDINFKYVPGKYMYIADTLSRAYLSNTEENSDDSDEMDILVHT